MATFAERMQRVTDLPSAKRDALRSAAEQITASQVYPAWQKAKALLDAELPRASDDVGLWRFPDGLRAYDYRLRQFTTTRMTAEDVHQTGLRMVATIESQMDALLRQMGRSEGTVRSRMDRLRADQMVFPPTEEGRAAYTAEINEIVRDAGKIGRAHV